MDDKKEKKGFWQSWMTITILMALTIMVFIFNSQGPSIRSEQDENISIGNSINVEDNNANITDNSTIIMDNDTYFKKSVEVNIGVIIDDLNCISEAGKNRDVNATERCGTFLRENSNIYLTSLSRYNVSNSLQTALDDYKKALEYYNAGGSKLETGARNKNTSQIIDAIEYIQNGTTYLDRVAIVLSGNATYNATSNATSNTTFVHPEI